MVEQLTLNQRVAGSSPARFTITFQRVSLIWFFTHKKLCPILCHTWLKILPWKGVHGFALRFHSDVRVAFHHCAGNVPGEGHHG